MDHNSAFFPITIESNEQDTAGFDSIMEKFLADAERHMQGGERIVDEGMQNMGQDWQNQNYEEDARPVEQWEYNNEDEMPALVDEQDNDNGIAVFGPQAVDGPSTPPRGRWGSTVFGAPMNSPLVRGSAYRREGDRWRIDMSKIETIDLTSDEPRQSRYIYTDDEEGANDTEPDTIVASSRMDVDDLTGGNDESDPDIEIVQPRGRTLARSSMKASTAVTQEDTLVTEPQLPTLAEQLKDREPIIFPQVIGKGAYYNPSLIDAFVATPALKEQLGANTHPPEVLWASFLMNNDFWLDCSSACDIMRHWLDHTPKRYEHISTLIFHEFLWHSPVCKQEFAPHARSTYPPFNLIAKCANLTTIRLRMSFWDAPGVEYTNSWTKPRFSVKHMHSFLNEYIGMDDLFTTMPQSVRTFAVDILVSKGLVDKYRSVVRMVGDELFEYLVQAAEVAEWSAERRQRVNFVVDFVNYGAGG